LSFAIDANVLLYASDSGCPQCSPAQQFLNDCVQSQTVFCLAWPTLMAYLRIATHPRIFAQPLEPQQAQRNIDQLLNLKHCRVVSEGATFWETYRALAKDHHPRGNLVPDLHLAAILRDNGIRRLYTCDRDFRRFEFLDVVNPIA
jgi:uncharacterized protein